MIKILLSVDSPGAAEFIAPAIPILRQKFKLSLVTVNTATEAPYKILKKYKPLRCDQEKDVEALYHKINPDILLVGISSLVFGPYVNNKLTHLAKREKKPIIAFQDYWANHRWPQNKKTMQYWDAVLVPDKLAEKFFKEDNYEGQIIVTGSPALDKLRNLNIPAMRAKLRKKLNIQENEFVVLYAGTGTPQAWQEDEATFRFLAGTLQEFFINTPNAIFIPRSHPRDEEKNRYQKIAPRLQTYNPDHGKTNYTTDDLLPIADCVISMYSTTLIHACFLRIPAISILLPNAGRKRLKKISLDNFPPNNVGATLGVYKESPKELLEVLTAIKNDAGYREKITRAQAWFFPIDVNKKTSAETVADAIESFIF